MEEWLGEHRKENIESCSINVVGNGMEGLRVSRADHNGGAGEDEAKKRSLEESVSVARGERGTKAIATRTVADMS